MQQVCDHSLNLLTGKGTAMAGQIRPDKKLMKLAYKILKTPKDRQQDNKKPTERQMREWSVNNSTSA